MWQCSSPGLADGEVPGGVTEVNIISPWAPGGLGLCTPGHQVINIIHLLERGGFFTSTKQLRKCTLLSRYFRLRG